MEGESTTEIFPLLLCRVKTTQKRYLNLVHKSESVYKRITKYFDIVKLLGRSPWPRCLRLSKAAAARLLRLWVWIARGAWTSVVSVVCCQVEVSATSWSLVQRIPTYCGASLCVIYKPREWGGPGLLGAVAPKTNNASGEGRELRTGNSLAKNLIIAESQKRRIDAVDISCS